MSDVLAIGEDHDQLTIGPMLEGQVSDVPALCTGHEHVTVGQMLERKAR